MNDFDNWKRIRVGFIFSEEMDRFVWERKIKFRRLGRFIKFLFRTFLISSLALGLSAPSTSLARGLSSKKNFAKGFPAATNLIEKKILRKGTLGEFVNHMRPLISKTVFKFLRKQARGIDKMRFEIRKLPGESKYQIITQLNSMTFEIKDIQKSLFLINNKPFNYDVNQSPEVLWNRLTALLPRATRTSSFFHYLLPEAHAVAFVTTISALALISWGVSAYGVSIANCNLYSYYLSKCGTGIEKDPDRFKTFMIEGTDQLAKPIPLKHLVCPRKDRKLRECLKTKFAVAPRGSLLKLPKDILELYSGQTPETTGVAGAN